MARVTPVAIALGSNLGDRRGHLAWALFALGDHLSDVRASSVIETEAEGVSAPQPPYLNAVVTGSTRLAAPALMKALLGLERERGRVRSSPRAPRTLDLDLILYGESIIDQRALTVPHPRFRERRFVLEPLAELAAAWRDPVTGRTVGELLADLVGAGPASGCRT